MIVSTRILIEPVGFYKGIAVDRDQRIDSGTFLVERRDEGVEHLVENQNDVAAGENRTRRMAVLVREGTEREFPALAA